MTEENRIGAYRIVRSIASGAMGEVHEAVDTMLQRTVALKILSPEIAANAKYIARFQQEARTLAKLDHPNIVKIYASGQADSHFFIAMELVEGETLEAIMARGAIPPSTALTWFRGMLAGVRAAHRAGVVHRDIKPANVIVRKDDTIAITDFGLAKSYAEPRGVNLTTVGMVVGTVDFMAPEIVSGTGQASVASDIYAMGIVLYEMITGKSAFGEEPALQKLGRIREGDLIPPRVANPALSDDLARFVLSLSAKDPAARPADLSEVERAMERVPEASAAPAGRPQGEARVRETLKSRGFDARQTERILIAAKELQRISSPRNRLFLDGKGNFDISDDALEKAIQSVTKSRNRA